VTLNAHEIAMSSLPELRLYIDGHWTAGASGKSLDIHNPATGERLNRLALGDAAQIKQAADAAARAFTTWRDTAPLDRTKILTRAAQLIRDHSERLARLTTLEMGMRLPEATILVERAADILDWDANEGRRLYGRVLPSPFGVTQTILREPIGPVASFAPWNGSIFTPCRKIGSALAAGCTLVLKAAEETPHTAVALVDLFEQAGVPPGVLNLVFGAPAEVSELLINDPRIRLVTFTGSVAIGKSLARMAAGLLKPTVMELGGHSPVIVCGDAKLEDAADKLVAQKYFGAGQICQTPSRLFVESSVAEEFQRLLLERIKAIRPGNGLDAATSMGPLFGQRRLNAIVALVEDAVSRGASVLAGGRKIEGPGYFYAPTLLADVPAAAEILHEEPFGPVMTLAKFDDINSAIEAANAVSYGLAAYAFTRSADTAYLLSKRLDCGMVGINYFGVSTDGMPFGGAKDSGYGREGGVEGIQNYTITKTVSQVYC
jgi:succinate-semialdehyde dehydrogenase/glutarate-semialdehyde dehydrogenase